VHVVSHDGVADFDLFGLHDDFSACLGGILGIEIEGAGDSAGVALDWFEGAIDGE